jgi:hypothetical protein
MSVPPNAYNGIYSTVLVLMGGRAQQTPISASGNKMKIL